jgi:hypothetical protein
MWTSLTDEMLQSCAISSTVAIERKLSWVSFNLSSSFIQVNGTFCLTNFDSLHSVWIKTFMRLMFSSSLLSVLATGKKHSDTAAPDCTGKILENKHKK